MMSLSMSEKTALEGGKKNLLYEKLDWREIPVETDKEDIKEIVQSTGFFSPPEIGVAVELVDERLLKGLDSGYYFLFAEWEGGVVGYACFGPIPCTLHSWDMYWIAVRNDLRGSGIGKEILKRAEEKISAIGEKRIYVETSSREQYLSTRSFYERCGYHIEATLKDFYSQGDHKVVYLKVLNP